MGKIISVVNNKGGVGKTTITANLAHALGHAREKKVLIVDVDSQCNSTSFFQPRSRLCFTLRAACLGL